VYEGLEKPRSDPGFVHINSLEFIVLVLQVVAALVAFTDPTFPNWASHPSFPVLLAFTDNTSAKAWTNKRNTKSQVGQNLLRFYAALLRPTTLSGNSEHIPGVANGVADFLSCPSNSDLLLSTRIEQLFLKHPSMRTWLFSSRIQNCYSFCTHCSSQSHCRVCRYFQRISVNSFPLHPFP
jgi:hypothetical protein